MSRHCPICRQIKRRKDTATCGAPDCVDAWKPLRADQRANFINIAEGDFPPLNEPTPPLSNEMLKSIFADKKGKD